MEAIRTYIDNVFAAFPQTERVLSLKREMLAGMEEKYYALKGEGKSEHEAVGSVIANFGSIDEIAAELGIEQGTPEPQTGIAVPREEALAYLNQTRKSAIGIGLGVWLILAGVSAMILIGGLTGTDTWGAAGIFALFLAITGAVPMFIVNSMRLSPYEHYDETTILLDTYVRAELEQQSAAFQPRFIAKIAGGVAVILLAVGAFVFTGTLWFHVIPLVLLLFIIGFAVFLFVTAGMTYSAYDVLLGKGDYANKKDTSKSERLIGTVAAVYWPLATAAYLLISFVYGNWHISWVIWPVAGVLFGAIAGGISAWYGQ